MYRSFWFWLTLNIRRWPLICSILRGVSNILSPLYTQYNKVQYNITFNYDIRGGLGSNKGICFFCFCWFYFILAPKAKTFKNIPSPIRNVSCWTSHTCELKIRGENNQILQAERNWTRRSLKVISSFFREYKWKTEQKGTKTSWITRTFLVNHAFMEIPWWWDQWNYVQIHPGPAWMLCDLPCLAWALSSVLFLPLSMYPFDWVHRYFSVRLYFDLFTLPSDYYNFGQIQQYSFDGEYLFVCGWSIAFL